MATNYNRKARRQSSKIKKEPWNLRLLDWSGATPTAGVYFDIINTSWRHAKDCNYSFRIGESWLTLLYNSKFYFAPVVPKFSCKVRTLWSPETTILFTLQGKGMLVNITYKRTDTRTLTLFFPNCVMDLSSPAKLVQVKSSTLYDCAVRCARAAHFSYNKTEIEDIYKAYIGSGMTPSWARIMCGMIPDDIFEEHLRTILVGDVLMELLQIFRTLAFLDYSIQLGYNILMGVNELSVAPRAVVDIESRCSNALSDVSSLKVLYSDDSIDKAIVGDQNNFFNAHTSPIPRRHIEWIRECCKDDPIDLDNVTQRSKENYFYLDQYGNPMKFVGDPWVKSANWLLAATGLTYSFSDHEIFGLYVRKNNCWVFDHFAILYEVYRELELTKHKGLSLEQWQPILNSKFVLQGKGIRDISCEDRELQNGIVYYKCSPDMLAQLDENSNIRTLDQMNFFIDGYVRMLRRKKIDLGLYTCYNTGLVSKSGHFIHLMIPNISGPKNEIQPDLVDTSTFDAFSTEPCCPFTDIKQLFISEGSSIALDEKALLHVLEDRSYRLPETLSGVSKSVLIECVRDSLRYSQAMIKSNPFFAQPCYSVQLDNICHLLPLYLGHNYDLEHLAGALFIRNKRVATLYSVEMARNHSCLFNTPRAIWLPD